MTDPLPKEEYDRKIARFERRCPKCNSPFFLNSDNWDSEEWRWEHVNFNDGSCHIPHTLVNPKAYKHQYCHYVGTLKVKMFACWCRDCGYKEFYVDGEKYVKEEKETGEKEAGKEKDQP